MINGSKKLKEQQNDAEDGSREQSRSIFVSLTVERHT